MSTSGRHQDIPTDTHPSIDLDTTVDTPVVDTLDAVHTVDTVDEAAGPVQLALATPDAHVRFDLDRRTREIGLAHVAEIKRQLAASAARRAEQQAVAGRPSGRRSTSDRAA